MAERPPPSRGPARPPSGPAGIPVTPPGLPDAPSGRLHLAISQVRRARKSQVATNLTARIGALVSLGVATVVVARIGGPPAVGVYALLRVLPWLLGVVLSGGLPGAIPYFLAGPARSDRRLPSTIIAIGVCSGAVGAFLWWAGHPLLTRAFFSDVAPQVVAWAALSVFTELSVVTVKACCQGSEDLPGANTVIVLEEFAFLPAYLLLLAAGVHGATAIVAALILTDVGTSFWAWTRLARLSFFRGMSRPSLSLARRIYGFGTRGQVGNVLELVNLRLDFVFIGALAGPGILGTYAIASKFAELLRLPPLALNYVLYPRYAKDGAEAAGREARRMIRRAGSLTAAGAIPLALVAGWVLPAVYGSAFRGAILPARILLLGLAGEGVAQVVSAYLYGVGKPGLNSLAMGSGVVVTVALDFLLVPRFHARGAAVASAIAYLTATTVLLACFTVLARRGGGANSGGPPGVSPGRARRALDVTVSAAALVLLSPVMLVIGLLVRMTSPGPALYRQERVGQGWKPFTLYKFRTMRQNARGPEVTSPDDPRVTRLGRVLRATSLDELPQVVNILLGHMTLVGPRPETRSLAERYPRECRWVFDHRPGLTGPVQIYLRGSDVPPAFAGDAEQFYLSRRVPDRVAMDRWYLSSPSFSRTVAMLADTVGHLFRHATGAPPQIPPELESRVRSEVGLVPELQRVSEPE